MSMEQQENFVAEILVKNKEALNAYRENLDLVEEVNIFKFDANKILKHAESCAGKEYSEKNT